MQLFIITNNNFMKLICVHGSSIPCLGKCPFVLSVAVHHRTLDCAILDFCWIF